MPAEPLLDYILTPKLRNADLSRLTALRNVYFPAERNYLEAHVTLFHKLPGALRGRWFADIEALAGSGTAFEILFGDVYFMGRGFGLRVESPELLRLRERLASGWRDFLSPQDSQKFKPHCTLQNKVEPARARADMEAFKATWSRLNSRVEGLQLWEYQHGPWKLDTEWSFGA